MRGHGPWRRRKAKYTPLLGALLRLSSEGNTEIGDLLEGGSHLKGFLLGKEAGL